MDIRNYIFIVGIVLCSSLVLAVDTTNLSFSASFTTDASDDVGTSTDTVYGATHITNASCLTDNNGDRGCYYFDGTGAINYSHSGVYNVGTGDFSLSCWMRTTSLASTIIFFNKGDDGQLNKWKGQLQTNPSVKMVLGGSNVHANPFDGGGDWFNVLFVRNNSIGYLYVNGSLLDSGSLTQDIDNTLPLQIGAKHFGSPEFFTGYIDQCLFFNSTISSADKNELANSTIPLNPLAAGSTISVNWIRPLDNDVYTNNVTFRYQFNVTGTNLIQYNGTFWFNGTPMVNFTNLAANLTQTINITQSPILDANISSYVEVFGDNGANANSSDRYVYWNLSTYQGYSVCRTLFDTTNYCIASLDQILIYATTLSQDDYAALHYNGTFTADPVNDTNASINFSRNDYVLVQPYTDARQTIDTTSFWVNPIDSYWQNIVNVSSMYYVDTVNSSLPGNYSVRTTPYGLEAGKLHTGSLYNGSMDELLLFSRPLDFQDVLLLAGGFNNTMEFIFLDEETGDVVPNVTFELISEPLAQNYSSPTGSTFVNGLPNAFYTIRYRSNGYYERFHYVNFSTVGNLNLTLYLVNSTNADAITIQILDNTNEIVPNAYIQLKRYFIETNSYQLVEMAKSNTQGDATIHAVLNDEFYQYLVYKPFNTLVGSSVPDYFRDTSDFIQVDLRALIAEDYDTRNNITYSLSFNNASDTFTLSYNNLISDNANVSLMVYEITARGKTIMNQSSSTSSAGLLVASVPVQNNTLYEAQAQVYFTSLTIPLATETYVVPQENSFGDFGLFLAFLLLLVAALLGVFSPLLGILLTVTMNLLIIFAGLIPYELISAAAGLSVLGLILGMLVHTRGFK